MTERNNIINKTAHTVAITFTMILCTDNLGVLNVVITNNIALLHYII